MGQLIMLENSRKTNMYRTGMTTRFNDCVDGTEHSFKASSNSNFAGPFYVATVGTTYTNSDTFYPFPHASSSSNIPTSQVTIPNEVGSCSIVFARASTGWTANITITGSGLTDETVNSLLFERKTNYGNYSQVVGALYFAYILDNPITLNAGNNYTANLTMSVSFE